MMLRADFARASSPLLTNGLRVIREARHHACAYARAARRAAQLLRARGLTFAYLHSPRPRRRFITARQPLAA